MDGSAGAVVALYRERINHHRFDSLAPLISPDAIFWFGDGSHVGREAIRSAFEATWARLVDETYWLDDLHWLPRGMGRPRVAIAFIGGRASMARVPKAMAAAPAFLVSAPRVGRSSMNI